jgi:hypothetical protein
MIQDTYDGDYPDDFEEENGRYLHHCAHCGDPFWGHKRRVACRLCATYAPDWFEPLTPAEWALSIAAFLFFVLCYVFYG